MRITRVYVVGCPADLRFTRCCIASIRHWYPEIPITLIKDGEYNTTNLERFWGVDVLRTTVCRFGRGWGRLEPLFLPIRERCMILDSDTAFAGPVLGKLGEYEEDFIVEDGNYPAEDIKPYYYDPELVCTINPSFRYPGFVFNVGQMVATTGVFKRDEFSSLVAFEEPRRCLRPELFECFEQGVLNFMLQHKAQDGVLSLRRHPFMRWPGALQNADVDVERLANGGGYDFLLHWAGFKQTIMQSNSMGHVLDYFERLYFERTIPLMNRDYALAHEMPC